MRSVKFEDYVLPIMAVFTSAAAAPSLAADRNQATFVAPVSETYRAEVVAAIAERNRHSSGISQAARRKS